MNTHHKEAVGSSKSYLAKKGSGSQYASSIIMFKRKDGDCARL
jgi:hypothetical protein